MSYNKLDPSMVERLALLAEEAAEVIHIVGKILRHGYDETHPNDVSVKNRESLAVELGHVIYAAGLLIDGEDVNADDVHASIIEKAISVKEYLHHQQDVVG